MINWYLGSKGQKIINRSWEEFRNRKMPKLQERLNIVNIKRSRSLHQILEKVDKRLTK